MFLGPCRPAHLARVSLPQLRHVEEVGAKTTSRSRTLSFCHFACNGETEIETRLKQGEIKNKGVSMLLFTRV
jgi:hypothetical protein